MRLFDAGGKREKRRRLRRAAGGGGARRDGRGRRGGEGQGKDGEEQIQRDRRRAAQETGTANPSLARISEMQERGVFVNAVDAECGLVRKKKQTSGMKWGGSPFFFYCAINAASANALISSRRHCSSIEIRFD